MAKPKQIGALKHRILIQNLALAADGQGGTVETWSDVATVWAEINPKSTRERLYTQSLQYQRTHVIRIRFRSDITNTMRINYQDRIFQIKGTWCPDEWKTYLMIDCEENQGS